MPEPLPLLSDPLEPDPLLLESEPLPLLSDPLEPDPLPLAMLRWMNQSVALGLFDHEPAQPATASAGEGEKGGEGQGEGKACPDGAG